MLYKILFSVILYSCTPVNFQKDIGDIKITTNLLTQQHQEEYSIIKHELEKLFFTTNTNAKKCNIDISITQNLMQSGVTSTTFTVNQTLTMQTDYTFICDSNNKTNSTISLTSELILIQDKTLGQYVGEQAIAKQIAKQTASVIYDEIKIFSIMDSK
ncbi:MAG: hypothetical protein ACI9CD_000037 [Candidatus Deianiraeaceae bacterium]|jgi:hypothetical protein